ncbi:MAG TPA: hypothetical protein VMX58_03055 [Patescibacteria group bacterium]|nr:hypothetical protein [Patescibacteria group bacterium]
MPPRTSKKSGSKRPKSCVTSRKKKDLEAAVGFPNPVKAYEDAKKLVKDVDHDAMNIIKNAVKLYNQASRDIETVRQDIKAVRKTIDEVERTIDNIHDFASSFGKAFSDISTDISNIIDDCKW